MPEITANTPWTHGASGGGTGKDTFMFSGFGGCIALALLALELHFSTAIAGTDSGVDREIRLGKSPLSVESGRWPHCWEEMGTLIGWDCPRLVTWLRLPLISSV